MTRLLWRGAASVVLLAACTPLGLWIYEDPVVTVHRVTFQLRESHQVGTSPVQVALAVDNRNDYPVSSKRMEVSLHLDGFPIGRLKQDSTVSLATETVSTVALPLELEKHATPSRLRVFGSGRHRFVVRGRAIFETPIGIRNVRFAEEGEMSFGQRSSRSPP